MNNEWTTEWNYKRNHLEAFKCRTRLNHAPNLFFVCFCRRRLLYDAVIRDHMPTFHERAVRNGSTTAFIWMSFSSAHTKFTRSMCVYRVCVCRVYAEWKNRFASSLIDALADSLGKRLYRRINDQRCDVVPASWSSSSLYSISQSISSAKATGSAENVIIYDRIPSSSYHLDLYVQNTNDWTDQPTTNNNSTNLFFRWLISPWYRIFPSSRTRTRSFIFIDAAWKCV